MEYLESGPLLPDEENDFIFRAEEHFKALQETMAVEWIWHADFSSLV